MSAQTTTQLCDMLANLLDQSRDREEALEEEVLRLEALVRAKDETLGELLELVDHGCFVTELDYCTACERYVA